MAIPRQLEEQERLAEEEFERAVARQKAAEEAVNQMQPPLAEDPAPPPEAPEEAAPAPCSPAAPEEAPPPAEEPPAPVAEQEIPAEPPADDQQPAAGTADEEFAKLQHKFDVLKGKYDTEVPRKTQEARELHQSNQLLQRQLQIMQQQLDAAPKVPDTPEAPAPGTEKVSDYYSAEMIEEYGEDFLKQQLAVAHRIAAESRKPIEASIANQRTTTLNSTIAALVPDFDRIDQDPAFSTWLDESIPLAGMTRREAMGTRYNAGDTRGVAEFYRQFGAIDAGQVTPAPAAVVPPQPAGTQPAAPSRSQQVAAQVTPRAAAAPAPDPDPKARQGRTYSTAEYQRLQRDIAIGKISGEDAQRIDKELDRALAEGRVLANA